MTEPDLNKWAKALIHMITGKEPTSPKTVYVVENELKDIAAKYQQIGYEDGLNNGWWREQEKENAKNNKED